MQRAGCDLAHLCFQVPKAKSPTGEFPGSTDAGSESDEEEVEEGMEELPEASSSVVVLDDEAVVVAGIVL